MSRDLPAVLLGMLNADFTFHPHAPSTFLVKRVMFQITEGPTRGHGMFGPDLVLYADGVEVFRDRQWEQLPGMGTLSGIPAPIEKLRQRVETLRAASVRSQQSEKLAAVMEALQA